MTIVKEQDLTAVYIRIANALGAPSDEAEVFANCMVRADLRGMYTQGAAMIPYSVWLIQERLMRFGVPFKLMKDEPGLALVDGGYGVGAVVATRAMELAIRKAQSVDVGCVWVQNGGDFMMTANHSMQALEYDMVGIVMRNEAPRVAPWGGREAFFFTNPISVAIPTAGEPPIVIDTAGGSFSVGQTVMAARDKRRLPSPHLVTSDGDYSDDPTRIVINPADRESGLSGALVTLGHKGLMWSLIVELFSGLLAGVNTSNLKTTNLRRSDPGMGVCFIWQLIYRNYNQLSHSRRRRMALPVRCGRLRLPKVSSGLSSQEKSRPKTRRSARRREFRFEMRFGKA